MEKVTVQWSKEAGFQMANNQTCKDLNPKTMLLLGVGQCAGFTAMQIAKSEKVMPKSFEITVYGKISTQQLQCDSIFTAFNVSYNVECENINDQIIISRAINLAHDKYCGMIRMINRIAPVSHEISIVSTGPAVKNLGHIDNEEKALPKPKAATKAKATATKRTTTTKAKAKEKVKA